jgi:hypothetical protein
LPLASFHKTLYPPLLSSVHSTCPTYFILFSFLSRLMSG